MVRAKRIESWDLWGVIYSPFSNSVSNVLDQTIDKIREHDRGLILLINLKNTTTQIIYFQSSICTRYSSVYQSTSFFLSPSS
jgi:hypothetical protein